MNRLLLGFTILAFCQVDATSTAAAAVQGNCRMAASDGRPAKSLFWRRRAARVDRREAEEMAGDSHVNVSSRATLDAPTVVDEVSNAATFPTAQDSEVWPPAWALFPAEAAESANAGR